MRDAAVPRPRVGLGDPQRRHRAPAQRRGRVDRLARASRPENPHRVPVPRLPGPCATTATSAPQHVPRREQPGVHGDRLQVAAERLPAVITVAGQPARPRRSAAHGAGEPGRQRPAVRHHVGDPRVPGASGRAAPASTAGRAECRSATTTGIPPRSSASRSSLVVRRSLLVDAEHHRLQRRVPGLDQVAGPGRVGRQPVGEGDDQGVARRCPGRARARSSFSSTRSPDLRACRPAPGRPAPAPGWRRRTVTSSSTAPGHSRRTAVTTAFRHRITPAAVAWASWNFRTRDLQPHGWRGEDRALHVQEQAAMSTTARPSGCSAWSSACSPPRAT